MGATVTSGSWVRRAAERLRWAGLGPTTGDPSLAAWHRGEASALGLRVIVDLWAARPVDAHEALAALQVELRRVDRLWQVDDPGTELARVNAEAGRRPVPVSAETFALLARAMAFSRACGGAFDVTAPGGRGGPCGPGATGAGWHRVLLDARDRSVRFERPGLRLSPGPLVHGRAIDLAAQALRSVGVRHAMLRADALVRLVGDRLGEPWALWVGDPRCPQARVTPLSLGDGALATGGAWAAAGGTDPPPQAPRSPSDAAPTAVAVRADDLATAAAAVAALVALPLADGLAFVEGLPGGSALALDAQGRLHASSRLDRADLGLHGPSCTAPGPVAPGPRPWR